MTLGYFIAHFRGKFVRAPAESRLVTGGKIDTMRRTREVILTVITGALIGASGSAHQPGTVFDEYFIDKTMRVDYFHAGGRGTEMLGLDQVVSDGPWAGSRTRLVDDLNLGKYIFEVIDRTTNGVIYSRGFASI